MKIVSGKTGTPHVSSHEFRQIIDGTIGHGSYILSGDDNLEPELVSNNLLRIKSGMLAHHGNVSSVENYDEIELTNGSQGVKRIDLVVARYTRNDETKIENSSWVLIQGTPDESSPVAPSYEAGDLQEGDLIDDCPYLEIHYDGISVTEVKKLLTVAKTTDDLFEKYNELDGSIGAVNTSVNSQDVSIPSGTSKYVTFTALPAGTWILIGNARFSANASGYRRANISETGNNSTDIDVGAAASPSGVTNLQIVKIVKIDSTSAFFLNLMQGSNSTLTCPAGFGYIHAIRIR
ncbi:MAG: hypothetical protein ACI4S2_01400 [Lachnospiraceae bacterium]